MPPHVPNRLTADSQGHGSEPWWDVLGQTEGVGLFSPKPAGGPGAVSGNYSGRRASASSHLGERGPCAVGRRAVLSVPGPSKVMVVFLTVLGGRVMRAAFACVRLWAECCVSPLPRWPPGAPRGAHSGVACAPRPLRHGREYDEHTETHSAGTHSPHLLVTCVSGRPRPELSSSP